MIWRLLSFSVEEKDLIFESWAWIFYSFIRAQTQTLFAVSRVYSQKSMGQWTGRWLSLTNYKQSRAHVNELFPPQSQSLFFQNNDRKYDYSCTVLWTHNIYKLCKKHIEKQRNLEEGEWYISFSFHHLEETLISNT